MYHPSTRLLTILELLQARGRMSGPELATRLEVSPRSVRRYVAMLQDMGIPIEGERGWYGQYRLRPGYKLPPLMFGDDEALAVTVTPICVYAVWTGPPSEVLPRHGKRVFYPF